MKKNRINFPVSSGFTLIELIIVFSVIAILSTVGIASFVSYSRAQTLQTAASDFTSVLNVAKSRALAQIKPGECTGQSLSGYQVDIRSNTVYDLGVVCSGNYYRLMTQTLPSNLSFSLTGQTTTISVFFPIISSGVRGAGTIILTGYGKTKTIVIDNSGNIK